MRLLTNPGSNVPESALARYDILLARQTIVVDHVEHDTRRDIPLGKVDEWVARAREFPKVTGSTAQDMVPTFLQALEKDPELLVVTTSKRLIQSYHSAQGAATMVRSRLAHQHASIAIVDTMSTDLGACLITIAAGEAIRAGLAMKDIVVLLEEMAARCRLAMHVKNLDHPMKSGRASFLKAWMATVLQVRPIIGIADGDLRILGRVREKDDPIEALLTHYEERLPGRPRVWMGIVHADQPERAERCAAAFRARFDVSFSLIRPFSASIYLYSGPAALGVFLIPMDGLPWNVPAPSPPLF